MTLREREDALFDRWERTISQGGLVRDGAGIQFEKQPFRLLFILKDPNDPDMGVWDMRRDIIDTGDRGQAWNNITRWTAAILNGAAWEAVATVSQDMRRHYLSKIATLNLKKIGGAGTSNLMEVRSWATANSDFLKEQAALYCPHLTILGGTFEIAREVFGWNGLPEHDGDQEIDKYFPATSLGVVLNFYHPAARLSSHRLFQSMQRDIAHLRAERMLPAE